MNQQCMQGRLKQVLSSLSDESVDRKLGTREDVFIFLEITLTISVYFVIILRFGFFGFTQNKHCHRVSLGSW